MKKQLISILAFLFLSTTSVFGQNNTGSISGEVYDQMSSLPEATIVVVGTKKGAITDFDGKFTITDIVAGDYKIIVSYIGYKNSIINVQVTESKDLNIGKIILETDAQIIDEVVITALGIKKKDKSIGYSVTNIKSDEFNEAKENNVVNSLNGKVAGVQITNGSSGIGSTSRIVIRGESSLTSGNNQPLFVIDGIPIDNNTFFHDAHSSSSIQEIDYGNGAADINPDDIASISVLKGANAAALYGSRGANGVILITTKTGDKSRKGINVSFNSSFTVESALRLPKYQNKYGQGWAGAFEYVDGRGSGINDSEDVSWGPIASGQLLNQFDSPAAGGLRAGDIYARGWIRNADNSITAPGVLPNDITATPFVIYKDNVSDFFEMGHTENINTSISINNDNSRFLLSAGLLNNEGIIPNTDLKKYSFRLNSNVDLSKKLKFSSGINYINSKSDNRVSSGYGSENPMYMFTWYGRSVNTNSLREYWQRGYEGTEQYNYNYAWHDNPFFAMYENTNAFDKDRILGNIKFSYDFSEKLKLQVKSGMDNYTDDRVSKRAFSTQRFLDGGYRVDVVKFREINTDFLLSYNTKMKKIGFGVNFGGNNMNQKRSFKSDMANKLIVPGIYNLQNSALPLIAKQVRENKEINSLYATFNTSYDDKIFLDFSGRNDWSSTLPKDNNSYFYPSVSLSAIVSEMINMPESVDFFKIRTSYAKVGNDTQPYNLQSTYQYQNPYFGNRTLTRSNTLLNENLKPEMITSFEVGTDFRMFKNRIGLDFTYYNSTSKDQIMVVPVSNATGFKGQVINAGEINNQGFEALLSLKPIVNDNFRWKTSFNFSKNIGKVVKLPDGIDVLTTGYASVYNAEGSKVFIQAREGEALGNMYGKVFERHDGKIIYKDGKPLVKDGIHLLGNYNPDFSLGFQNSFKYKKFNLSFLFDWKQGGILISRTKQIATYAGNLEGTGSRDDYNDVVPDGVKESPEGSGNYVALTEADAIGWWSYLKPLYNRKEQQETGIVDATYVKLREVKLGYSLSRGFVKKLNAQDIKISLVGRNLALFTPSSNPHFDPETLAMQGANIVPGIEDVSYPSSRSIGINFNIKF